jgi:hypothetical protein
MIKLAIAEIFARLVEGSLYACINSGVNEWRFLEKYALI